MRDKWNERCKIVKAENTATHDQRQRQAALELCNTYRFNLSTIHQKHHCLFRKTKHYFKTATIENIIQWQKQVIVALQYTPTIQTNTMHTFLGIPKPEPAKKATTRKRNIPTVYPPTLRTHIKFKNIETQGSSNITIHHTQKREAQSTIDTTNAKRQRQSTMKESFQFGVHHSPIPATIHLPFQIPQQDQAIMKETQLQITSVTPKNIITSIVVNRAPIQNYSSRYGLRKRKRITYTEWNEQVETYEKRNKNMMQIFYTMYTQTYR